MLKLGGIAINKLMLGPIQINKLYLGENEIQINPYPPLNGNERVIGKGGATGHLLLANTTYTRNESRWPIVVGRQPVKSIRFVYWNGYVSQGEKNTGNALTIRCALEYNGVTVQVAINKSMSGYLLSNGGYVVTEQILPSAFGLSEFPANALLWARTDTTHSSSDDWPFPGDGSSSVYSVEARAGNPIGQISNAATSQLLNSGPITTPAGGLQDYRCFGPAAIIGEWADEHDISLMLDGDSIPSGYNDTQDNGITGGGFITHGTRSVGGGIIPSVKIARASERALNWGTAPFRKYLMRFCTHYISNIGTNDIQVDSRTAAQVLANKQTIWADFRANGAGPQYVIDVPLAPRVTSTDSYVTTANQTPASVRFNVGANRDQLNSSILALLGQSNGPDDIIDVNLDWQDVTDTKAWKVTGVPNAPTSDGTHPSAAYHSTAGSRIATDAATWPDA